MINKKNEELAMILCVLKLKRAEQIKKVKYTSRSRPALYFMTVTFHNSKAYVCLSVLTNSLSPPPPQPCVSVYIT